MSFPSVLAAVWAVGWAEKTNWNSRRLEIVKSSQLFWSFLSHHSLLQLLTSHHAGWRAVRNGERSWHGDGRVSHIKDFLWRSWQQPADWQCVRQSAELQSHVGSVWTLCWCSDPSVIILCGFMLWWLITFLLLCTSGLLNTFLHRRVQNKYFCYEEFCQFHSVHIHLKTTERSLSWRRPERSINTGRMFSDRSQRRRLKVEALLTLNVTA